MNITINSSKLTVYDFNPGQTIYVEELCKPFVASLSKAYLTIAIFNICYIFLVPIIRRWEHVILLKIESHLITVKDILSILEIIFFLLNFFVFGYWIVLNKLNIEWFVNLPFIEWFV